MLERFLEELSRYSYKHSTPKVDFRIRALPNKSTFKIIISPRSGDFPPNIIIIMFWLEIDYCLDLKRSWNLNTMRRRPLGVKKPSTTARWQVSLAYIWNVYDNALLEYYVSSLQRSQGILQVQTKAFDRCWWWRSRKPRSHTEFQHSCDTGAWNVRPHNDS